MVRTKRMTRVLFPVLLFASDACKRSPINEQIYRGGIIRGVRMANSVDKTGIGRAVTRLYRRRRNTFRLETFRKTEEEEEGGGKK